MAPPRKPLSVSQEALVQMQNLEADLAQIALSEEKDKWSYTWGSTKVWAVGTGEIASVGREQTRAHGGDGRRHRQSWVSAADLWRRGERRQLQRREVVRRAKEWFRYQRKEKSEHLEY
uniref:Uncharacterized protein n=1 Tax=Saccharum officinarum TaxID=4547 RepID=A0A678THX1_SACOF|nr:hypothetical protein SO104I06_000011 [Saccharum officinarum]